MGPDLALTITLITTVTLALLAWPASRICRRVGFSPWLGVLIIVPIVNVVLLWFVALARWPAMRPSDSGA